jgi:hypothetical protein
MHASSRIISALSEPGIALHRDTPELASAYDRTSLYQFENGKQLVSALSISVGECVLDIGAGTGHLAAYVGKIVGPSGWVVGIDPLPLRISNSLFLDAGSPTPAVHRVLSPVSSTMSSAHFGLQLGLDLAGIFIGERAVPAGIGVDCAA